MSTVSTEPVAAERDPRYPIGKQNIPEMISPELHAAAIEVISELPEDLRNAVDGLNDDQLNTPYREDGWTVRQLVHHIADSHSQGVARIRFALTEECPTVSGYKEKAWAELHDAHDAPIEWSLEIIEALHARWVMLLQSLNEAQWKREFVHTERGKMTIEHMVMVYEWHCRHHTAHITHLRKLKGW